MECKAIDRVKDGKPMIGIDLTRMECKEGTYCMWDFGTFGIDLTRMECKVDKRGIGSDCRQRYRFNQNGM